MKVGLLSYCNNSQQLTLLVTAANDEISLARHRRAKVEDQVTNGETETKSQSSHWYAADH